MANKFTWTEEFKKTWDEENTTQKSHTHQHTLEFNPNRKGIVRDLVVVIDVSKSIEKSDFLPTIRSNVLGCLEGFTSLFAETNPLSSLGFMTYSDRVQKISKNFSKDLLSNFGAGNFSLMGLLTHIVDNINSYSTITAKECLIITGSMGSVDENMDYDGIISKLLSKKIKIHIISICAEVTFFKKICQVTGGKFVVPYDTVALKSNIKRFLTPTETFNKKCAMVEVGFPKKYPRGHLCMCHFEYHEELYECPKCKAPICDIPTLCVICGLNLVSAYNICTSMAINYPLEPFQPINQKNRENAALNENLPATFEKNPKSCGICEKSAFLECPKCKIPFCKDCDHKIHETIQFCPFC